MAKKTTTKKITKKSVKKRAAAKKTAKISVRKKAATKKATTKRSTKKKTVTKKAATKKAASKKSTKKKAAAKEVLTIDGKEIEFIANETILQAAERAGIYIPRLCYIDGMTPYGGCRLCIVKVTNDRRPIKPSCSTPATPGMDIITKDNELQRMRKDIVQLIISEHPNTCMVCGHKNVCKDYDAQFKERPEKRVFGCFSCSQKNDCELREIVEYIGTDDLTHEFEYKNYDIENLDPFFERHYSLCIVCGKCVRVCGELRGINAIDFYGRGHDLRISTPMNLLHLETNCQFCGACVDVCPTGVLVPKTSTWTRNRKTFVESTCGHCSVACGLKYYTEGGKLVEIVPNQEAPVNKGQACVFGRFCIVPFNQRTVDHIHAPLLKTENKQNQATYTEAYARCKSLFQKYSPDQIAFLASPDLSNESAFILSQFASQVIHSPLISTITDGNYVEHFRELSAFPRSFDNIPNSDWVLLIDANPQITHPILLIRIKKAKDFKKKIISLQHKAMEISPETKWLLDENVVLTETDLVAKLEDSKEFQKGAGSILLGSHITSNILTGVINLCLKNSKINVLPLRSRANLEGVYNIIPQSEESVLEAIKTEKVKLLVSTERLPPEYATHVENIILLDIFPSDFSTYADVILPVTTVPESSGTMTNAEFQTQKFHASIPPFKDAKPDWQIFCELARDMGATGFDYTLAEDITPSIPEFPILKPSDIKPLPIGSQSIQYGKAVTWDDFVFRGEKIANRVDDLKTILEFRKTNDRSLISETLGANYQDKENAIEIEITGQGLVHVGTQTFGLESIKSIVEVAEISNYRLKFTIDTSLPNFKFINRNKFCMCYNYKGNLAESKFLLEFNPKICDIYFRVNNGKEITEVSDGLIMIENRYVNITDDEYSHFGRAWSDEEKMQLRALHRAHQLFKNPDIFYNFGSQDGKEPSDVRANWDFWDPHNETAPEFCSSIVKPTYRVVRVNQDLCMGCGTCQAICPHEAISYTMVTQQIGIYGEKVLRKANIDETKCYDCSKCVTHCPVNAISIREWAVE